MKAPANLSYWVGAPVRGDDFHLRCRQGLCNSMGARAIVVSLVIPMAFFGPKSVQARVLIIAPVVLLGHNRFCDRLGTPTGTSHL